MWVWLWIVVVVLVVLVVVAGVWASRPRRGVDDAAVRRRQLQDQVDVERFRRPDTNGGIGMK